MQFPPSKSTPAFPSVTLCTIPLYMWKGFFGDHDHPGQEKGKLGELRLCPRQQHRDALLAARPCLCLRRRGVPLDEVSDNQAQKMFGNRWTEIAKVVSGRTDNAVKNRFSTLCKKRAKFEASSKENSVPSLDPSNKRVLVEEPSIAILIGEPSTSNKQMGFVDAFCFPLSPRLFLMTKQLPIRLVKQLSLGEMCLVATS
ncbi:hypothetical protein ZIOFF_065673 [Zingiber officinale]|uniref:HTH myb-type domain-containing protein n=1 Tax=Zingiber officinale TaxID=94328 RepID=A0A8J5KHA2_ZINOF|nr:hypothetical protein ZIOFF_065673 [Zingiber officinale]